MKNSQKIDEKKKGTFIYNKKLPIHRWFQYLEGYSPYFVQDIIDSSNYKITSIYDPFCGTGTTPLVASSNNIVSYYSETNPFMRQVIEAKINSSINLHKNVNGTEYLKCLVNKIENYKKSAKNEIINLGGFEKYYSENVLQELGYALKCVNNIDDFDSKEIATVLLCSISVRSSSMIRHGDLRKAKLNEKKATDFELLKNFHNKLKEAIEDIEDDGFNLIKKTKLLEPDARNVNRTNLVDCVITSPPYLNGTNYIRNTKLELNLGNHLKNEKEISSLHNLGIVAGINNVNKNKVSRSIDILQPYLKELEPVSYDSRIQKMIAMYFTDMDDCIKKISDILIDGGNFYMDIGDSQFAGVHIPTHEILIELCKRHHLKLINRQIIRKRKSKNQMVLSQQLLTFKCKD